MPNGIINWSLFGDKSSRAVSLTILTVVTLRIIALLNSGVHLQLSIRFWRVEIPVGLSYWEPNGKDECDASV